MKSAEVYRASADLAKCGLAEMKSSGRQCRLVKLQRPPPEIRIFLPQRSECSSTATRRPRLPASMAHMRPAAPPPRIRTSKLCFIAAINSKGIRRHRMPTDEPKLPSLDLHHFLFFAFAHLFHLLDFVIGKLLDLVDCPLFIVFGDFLVFHCLLDAVVAIAANVADGGAVLLEYLVKVFNHVFAAFLG